MLSRQDSLRHVLSKRNQASSDEAAATYPARDKRSLVIQTPSSDARSVRKHINMSRPPALLNAHHLRERSLNSPMLVRNPYDRAAPMHLPQLSSLDFSAGARGGDDHLGEARIMMSPDKAYKGNNLRMKASILASSNQASPCMHSSNLAALRRVKNHSSSSSPPPSFLNRVRVNGGASKVPVDLRVRPSLYVSSKPSPFDSGHRWSTTSGLECPSSRSSGGISPTSPNAISPDVRQQNIRGPMMLRLSHVNSPLSRNSSIQMHDPLSLRLQRQRLASLRFSMALSPRNSFMLTSSTFRTKGFVIGAGGMRKSNFGSGTFPRMGGSGDAACSPSPLSSPSDAAVEAGVDLRRNSRMFAVQQLSPKNEGTSFSDFELLGKSGSGASASVLKALRLDRLCLYALKCIDVHSQDKRRQLVSELQTFCSIAESPHTVRFHGAYYNEGRAMLVLEYMNRGSLQNVVEATGKLPENVILHFIKPLLLALECIHYFKLVHRDVKPANVLIRADGIAKLTDFGITTDRKGQELSAFVGTQMYMSPERLNGETYGEASDVWSVGLILAFCAIGHYPYDSSDGFFGILQSLNEQPVPDISKTDYSDAFRDLIEHCLQLEPSERWTASELVRHPVFDGVDLDFELDWELNKWLPQDAEDLHDVATCIASSIISDKGNLNEEDLGSKLDMIAFSLGTTVEHVSGQVRQCCIELNKDQDTCADVKPVDASTIDIQNCSSKPDATP